MGASTLFRYAKRLALAWHEIDARMSPTRVENYHIAVPVRAAMLVSIVSFALSPFDSSLRAADDDPLAAYFVSHYNKDAPNVGFLTGVYHTREAA